ncbi:MAG: penicillin-binding transpeptidase domain-containing protein [Gammaproteobacteria bacterium]|nr:penicillin-binding transpeptidase domain-containing protein [Gammaproteobacteria bacterium]
MIIEESARVYHGRRWLVFVLLGACIVIMLWRAVDLQVVRQDFLREYGDARSVRVVDIPAHRGMIVDRSGEPLAISTPVNSIWTTPRQLLDADVDLAPLAELLDMTQMQLLTMLRDRIGREFVYLRRHAEPDLEQKIMALDLPGVYREQEYRRYYPAAEVTGHVVGFTNVDDRGQEGLELAYDEWLKGTPGKKRVLKDRLGRVVENIESIKAPDPGRTLELSIDLRIQYLAYRALKLAVTRHRARSGSLVLMDAKSGEVLAMVNQPSYNPNNRSGLKSDHFRNRSVTDVFEPGSTMKPFTVAAALESGLYQSRTPVDTTPGFYKVGEHTIRDIRNYGLIDVATVIKKSSNVGASKIALSLEPGHLWNFLTGLGFGQPTGSGYPGESNGKLDGYNNWSDVELATLSFGYGLSVTALQLAQAYTVIAADGLLQPVTMLKREQASTGIRVMSTATAQQVRAMMQAVVADDGTGKLAAVSGYRVAGKTGTVHKSTGGGYAEDRYLSLFAGMVPMSDPRLVMVVMIDEPAGEKYFGGLVAAPVFSQVMTGALRLMNIPPDDLPALPGQVVANLHERRETH